MEEDVLGDRMASLLDTKQRASESIEKSEKLILRFQAGLEKVKETMKLLRTQHKIVVFTEYEYLKNREKEITENIERQKEKIATERDGLRELDGQIEETMIDINKASRHHIVLEFYRDGRRHQV